MEIEKIEISCIVSEALQDAAYLAAMGKSKNDFLNRLLDGERKK